MKLTIKTTILVVLLLPLAFSCKKSILDEKALSFLSPNALKINRLRKRFGVASCIRQGRVFQDGWQGKVFYGHWYRPGTNRRSWIE
jgi:hypothetical protein